MPHPRTGRPAQFLFTHHGKRLSQNALRAELNRAAKVAGIDHVTPHQLRHTYATALANAGVSLQSLMVLLGHVSAAMSLRYGKLFDTTVRTECERAVDLAKSHIGVIPTGRQLPGITGNADWKDTPVANARPASGYCRGHPSKAPAATPISASTALYRDPQLRAVIEEHRAHRTDGRTLSGSKPKSHAYAPRSKPSPPPQTKKNLEGKTSKG